MNQTIKHTVADRTWSVTITSKVDDETELPAPPSKAIETVVVDLGDVRHVNSIGVRSWVQWIRSIFTANPNAQIQLQRLPLIFIRLRQSFSDMIPEKSRIGSFFVSYYCPDCMTTHEDLIDATGPAKDFHKVDHYPSCAECKQVMDTEIDPAVYQQMMPAVADDSAGSGSGTGPASGSKTRAS